MPRPQQKIKSDRAFIQTLADGLRHTARNPTIEKYVPHPKQLEFHTALTPGRQFIGGNRSGKTVAGATEMIMYATGKHPYKELPWEPPLRLRAVTVDLIQGLEKIMKPMIQQWMPPSSLINGSWEDSYDKALRTLTLANGSFIEFMTYEQDLEKFAGTSRHGIWFDEEPPKDIFTECRMRLLDTEGHWWMTMTPVEGMTWTYEEIYEAHSDYVTIVEVDMDENPHLTNVGKQIALSGLSKHDIDARKHGQYVSIGGLIYPEFNFSAHPDGHVLEPIENKDLPVGALYVESMDHGYNNPTGWLWAFITKDGVMVIFDELYLSETTIGQIAMEVHKKNALRERPSSYTVGDPSIKARLPNSGISVQMEYMDCGIPIMLGNNDVIPGIDRVKKLLNLKKLYVTRNCTNLLWEMKRYKWATWRHTNDRFDKNKKEEPQKKDDHLMDTLRYLIASRPEVEDGITTPKPWNSLGVGVATGIDEDLIDRELSKTSIEQFSDSHLGVDF